MYKCYCNNIIHVRTQLEYIQTHAYQEMHMSRRRLTLNSKPCRNDWEYLERQIKRTQTLSEGDTERSSPLKQSSLQFGVIDEDINNIFLHSIRSPFYSLCFVQLSFQASLRVSTKSVWRATKHSDETSVTVPFLLQPGFWQRPFCDWLKRCQVMSLSIQTGEWH